MTIDKYLLSMVIEPRLDQGKRIAETALKYRVARRRPENSAKRLLICVSSPLARGFGAKPMSLTVKIGEAKTRLSELLAKVEAGEEVIIARGADPIARLTRIPRAEDFVALIAEVKAARAGRAKTTPEELLAWRDEGRRF
jgi:antitoxin (DNA-binding transcriptional repressor) of toxin-antitoxin stability system